jgi:hypothetical protein
VANFRLPTTKRDQILGDKGLIEAYQRDENDFRALVSSAYSMAVRTLRDVPGVIIAGVPPVPNSEDCEVFLVALLENDTRWRKICKGQLGHMTGRFVQQITELMAQYLIDVYWARLVVSG